MEDVYYEHSLQVMVDEGLDGLRRRHRRRFLKFGVHTWQACKSLISIAVALAIFGSLQTGFETICASILILIYTNLLRGNWSQSINAAALNKAGYLRFAELKKLANREPGDREMEALWELNRTNDKTNVSYLVADVGYNVVNLIAFVNLFGTVL